MKVAFTENENVKSRRLIYTPSPFAKNNLVYLQEVGELRAIKPYDDKRIHLASCLLFYVEEGEGLLLYKGVEYTLHKGQCVFIDCNSTYEHRTDIELWNLKWIHFYGEKLSAIYDFYTERGGLPVFELKSIDSFERIWNDLMTVASCSDAFRDLDINGKLNTLLTLIFNDSVEAENHIDVRDKRRQLVDVKQYLEDHFREHITVDEVADRFFINKHYLGRIFKQQYGMTLNSYIIYLRVVHAKYLLRFSDMTMDRIAVDCGINDANYFSRMFKNVEGMTPSEFRKSW